MAKSFPWCKRLSEATDDVIGTVLHHAIAPLRAKGAVSALHRVERLKTADGEHAFLSVAIVFDAPPSDLFSAHPSAWRTMQGDLAARFDVHATLDAVSRDDARGLVRDGWYVLPAPVDLPQMPMLYAGTAKPRPASPPSAVEVEPAAPPPPNPNPSQGSLF